MRTALIIGLSALVLGCAGPSTGSLKGILVVYEPDADMEAVSAFLDEIQLRVVTVEPEDVFDFSVCSRDRFEGDIRTRRTVLFLTDDPEKLPDGLEEENGIYRGEDLWASDQKLFGVVLPGFTDTGALSGLLEKAYDHHLHGYIYGSFVSTQMSSPGRIDSLLTLGFSIDIPKSYHLVSWDPETGFIQYRRRPSEHCLLMFSVRWIEDDVVLSPEGAVLWRESVARNHFHDSRADSVDRSSVRADPISLRGLSGWRITGMWRNPEHLNAGAFTSYVLRHEGRRYLMDMEVFHERREKEPYIREGWLIMNTFATGDL